MQDCIHAPQAAVGRVYRPRNPRATALYRCAIRHAPELRAGGRFGRRVEENVIGRFLDCGDPRHGFARIYCDQCRHGCILAFSCKARYFCPSCHHLVRYAGWYSNRSRGKRRRMTTAPAEVATRDVDVREAARVRSTWARLIHKVYEVDPLECPRCKGPMRLIALIEDKAVIRKILTHLGLWVPRVEAGRGPGPPAPDPPRPAARILTYHPVPDIA